MTKCFQGSNVSRKFDRQMICKIFKLEYFQIWKVSSKMESKRIPHDLIYIIQISYKVHSLNSGKVSIQILLKVLPGLSEWTIHLEGLQ